MNWGLFNEWQVWAIILSGPVCLLFLIHAIASAIDGRQSQLLRGQLAERDAEWMDWVGRRDAALNNGEEFTEPSPFERRRGVKR